jgi:hypothetical protein
MWKEVAVACKTIALFPPSVKTIESASSSGLPQIRRTCGILMTTVWSNWTWILVSCIIVSLNMFGPSKWNIHMQRFRLFVSNILADRLRFALQYKLKCLLTLSYVNAYRIGNPKVFISGEEQNQIYGSHRLRKWRSKLQRFKTRIPRKIFGTMKYKLTRKWENHKTYNFVIYSLLHIILLRSVNTVMMKWINRTEEETKQKQNSARQTLRRNDHFESEGEDGWVILKLVLYIYFYAIFKTATYIVQWQWFSHTNSLRKY